MTVEATRLGPTVASAEKFMRALCRMYVQLDCSMVEINPLFKTSDNKIIAVDCKMNIDDNALMRHPDIAVLRDISEEDPTEVEAGKYNLNFVKLDGNVGCMVNGAGLAMATMDVIKLYGGNPANNGQSNDPMVGGRIGGINVFGGGLALYGEGSRIVGASAMKM